LVRGRLEAVRVDRELGHEPCELLVPARQVRARLTQVHAQVRGGRAGGRAREVVLDLDRREAPLAVLRERDAVREVGLLALGAGGEGGAGVDRLQRLRGAVAIAVAALGSSTATA